MRSACTQPIYFAEPHNSRRTARPYDLDADTPRQARAHSRSLHGRIARPLFPCSVSANPRDLRRNAPPERRRRGVASQRSPSPATPIMPTRRRSTSSLVLARHGSARSASPCVRGTGSRCRPLARVPDGQLLSDRSARLSMRFDDAWGRDRRVSRFWKSRRGVADPTSPAGFRRIGLFRAGSGTLDYWEGEPEAGSG